MPIPFAVCPEKLRIPVEKVAVDDIRSWNLLAGFCSSQRNQPTVVGFQRGPSWPCYMLVCIVYNALSVSQPLPMFFEESSFHLNHSSTSHRRSIPFKDHSKWCVLLFWVSLLLIPPSHQRHGTTAVLGRHKQQWHRHDCCGSAVVPSLFAVAPRKTQNCGPSRWLLTCSVPLRVGPIRSGIAAAPPWPPWHHTRTAVASPSSPLPPQYNRRAIAKK